MKKCPFCAEEIQDEAVFCRHCHHDFAPAAPGSAAPTAAHGTGGGQPSPAPKTSSRTLALLGALIVVGGLAWAGSSSDGEPTVATAGMMGGPSTPPAPPPPRVIDLGDQSALEVKAGAWVSQGFTVDDPRTCTLRGRTVGLAGGRKDVDVIVLDDDAFTNLKNNLSFTPLFRSGQSAAVTLDVTLPRPGKFHVVWSNTFSAVTDKVAQTSGMLVRCE